MGKSWMTASGKGGVGKTTISAALSLALAGKNHKVCLIDADIGLRDLDAVLGVENNVVYDLLDVLDENCRLGQALVSPSGISLVSLLPAAQFARCKDVNHKSFCRLIASLKDTYDDVIIDCPAGIEKGIRNVMCSEIDNLIAVCTPDDVCIRDVERLLSLSREKSISRGQLIVNRLIPQLIAKGEMYTAQTVSEVLDTPLLGEIPDDMNVTRALVMHSSFMSVKCEAAKAVQRIAGRMAGENIPFPNYGIKKRWFSKRSK